MNMHIFYEYIWKMVYWASRTCPYDERRMSYRSLRTGYVSQQALISWRNLGTWKYMQWLWAIFGLLVCVLLNVIHSNSSNPVTVLVLNIVASSMDSCYWYVFWHRLAFISVCFVRNLLYYLADDHFCMIHCQFILCSRTFPINSNRKLA